MTEKKSLKHFRPKVDEKYTIIINRNFLSKFSF